MPPAWAAKAQRILVPLLVLDLAIQYIAGILTNAYGPAGGFTDSTSFPYYDVHWDNGVLLGILALVTLIVVALNRNPRFIGTMAVAFVAIVVAAVEGMRYVHTSPNDPVATSVMGISFLVAIGAVQGLNFLVMRERPSSPPTTPVPPTTA